jgi:hypothetical protein
VPDAKDNEDHFTSGNQSSFDDVACDGQQLLASNLVPEASLVGALEA